MMEDGLIKRAGHETNSSFSMSRHLRAFDISGGLKHDDFWEPSCGLA